MFVEYPLPVMKISKLFLFSDYFEVAAKNVWLHGIILFRSFIFIFKIRKHKLFKFSYSFKTLKNKKCIIISWSHKNVKYIEFGGDYRTVNNKGIILPVKSETDIINFNVQWLDNSATKYEILLSNFSIPYCSEISIPYKKNIHLDELHLPPLAESFFSKEEHIKQNSKQLLIPKITFTFSSFHKNEYQ